jgi:hypothetical protein
VWLAIPVVALVLAILWALWASRTPPRADTHETLAEHDRFKRAFDPERPRRRPRRG